MYYQIRVGVNCARPGPPLAPVLGQPQLKVADFITEYNRLTANYVNCDGLILTCRLRKLSQPQKFVLQVKEPSFFVLWYTVDRHVPITTFYDSYYFYYRRWPTPVEARTLLGQLQAAHWQIS